MSDAKRDNHAFRRTAAVNEAGLTHVRSVPAKTQRLEVLDILEVAPPWGSAGKEGRDPYNAVGTRTANRMTTRTTER